MPLKKLIANIGTAAALAFPATALPSCAEKEPVTITSSPRPICNYDATIEETEYERFVRLGENYEGCKEAIPGHNDRALKRLNIVLVGMNYEANSFRERMRNAVSCNPEDRGILSIEPFTSNYDNINFWYVNQIGIGEEYPSGSDEATAVAVNLAEACDVPNKAILVLADWYFQSNANVSKLRNLNLMEMNLALLPQVQEMFPDISYNDCKNAVLNSCPLDNQEPYTGLCSAIEELRGSQDPSLDQYICAIISEGGNIPLREAFVSSAADVHTHLHELGHSIFGFYDEYVDGDRPSSDNVGVLNQMNINGLNCFPAATEEACENESPWGGPCFEGCGSVLDIAGIPVWRSIDYGMMRYEENADTFGEWNKMRMCYTFYAIAGNALGVCQDYLPFDKK